MASPLDSLLHDISKVFSPELPKDLGGMDDHLDFILSKVVAYGEDLRETHFWHAKRWKEIREEEDFHEVLLHIFNPGGEYLIAIDGNLMKGSWKQLQDNNSLILEMGGKSELFDLRFLNNDFMVLTKHGDQARKGNRRYFLFAFEPVTKGRFGDLDWRNLMERMFNIWRENSLSLWAWASFILVLAVVVWLSLR